MFKSLLARAREIRAAELEGEGGSESGFTLIELMVVLLIIAILLAVAIPTFLGVSGSARDRSAQSSGTNALTDLIAYFQNSQTYDATSGNTSGSNTDASGQSPESQGVAAQEPAFTWQDGTTSCAQTAAPKCVSIQAVDAATSNDGQGVIMAIMSQTGTCWFVANLQYGSSANPAGTVASTGFSTASSGKGEETSGGSEITLAGTYYSQLQNAGANCNALEPLTQTGVATPAAWSWGSSYSNAPNK